MAHADSSTLKTKDNWNPVILYNKTGHDIAYTFIGTYGGIAYAIKKNGSDEYVRIQVGDCNEATPYNGCKSFSALAMCTGKQHYNADLIRTVVIDSNDSCSITCTDRSTTSCLQSG